MNLPRKCLSVSSLLLGACLLCASAVRGQSTAGMVGTVLDQFGGIIPGANVMLFSDDQVLTTKANENGIFRFASLPSGTRYIEASSQGFASVSIPITEKTPERVSFALWAGGGSYVTTECSPPNNMLPTLVSYEKRSSDVQLTGSVTDLSRVPLSDTSLTLLRADLNAPLTTAQNRDRGFAMTERSFKESVIAEVASNEKGEFQFNDLEPGWYTLKGARFGYSNGSIKFWVARENLTRLSRIYLFPVPPNCR